jgi:protein-tyrosine phosphatase
MYDLDMGYYPARKICKNVWIGSQGDACSDSFMRENNVRLIVNCTRDIPFYFEDIPAHRVSVDDDVTYNHAMLKELPFVVTLLESHSKQRGISVLVHCYAGMQRSATCVAAWIMKTHGWTPARTIAWLQAKKPETFRPFPTFEKALWEYYSFLREQ